LWAGIRLKLDTRTNHLAITVFAADGDGFPRAIFADLNRVVIAFEQGFGSFGPVFSVQGSGDFFPLQALRQPEVDARFGCNVF